MAFLMNVQSGVCSNALLWTHWEEFIGANKGAGYQQNIIYLLNLC